HQKDQFGFHIRDLESLSTPFAWGHLKNNPWRLSSSLDSKEGAGFPWNPATKREGASAPWNPEKGASAPWNPATKREGASAPWNPQRQQLIAAMQRLYAQQVTRARNSQFITCCRPKILGGTRGLFAYTTLSNDETSWQCHSEGVAN